MYLLLNIKSGSDRLMVGLILEVFPKLNDHDILPSKKFQPKMHYL